MAVRHRLWPGTTTRGSAWMGLIWTVRGRGPGFTGLTWRLRAPVAAGGLKGHEESLQAGSGARAGPTAGARARASPRLIRFSFLFLFRITFCSWAPTWRGW